MVKQAKYLCFAALLLAVLVCRRAPVDRLATKRLFEEAVTRGLTALVALPAACPSKTEYLST